MGTFRLRVRASKSIQQVWSVSKQGSPSSSGEVLIELCGKKKGTQWAKTTSIDINPIAKSDIGQTVFVLYQAHPRYDIGILKSMTDSKQCSVKFPGENGLVEDISSRFLVVYKLNR